jgi:phosphoglycolate phosphatase
MKKFDLIVFDWDGTLMDSEARIRACMQAAAADLALPVPATEAIREIIGLGLYEAVVSLYPDIDESSANRVVERYRHHYLVENATPSPLFHGSAETIRALESMGFLLAVATGKGRRGLDSVLESTGLGPCFHTTRSADDAFSKPHPDMLLQILDQLGVDADRALMVGDTAFDLQMAANARVASLAVTYGVHSRERLQRCNPLGYIDDIREIRDWLKTES